MEARPGGITDAQVAAAVTDDWGFDTAGIEYVPLGFGSYHWLATDPSGGRRFVTVDDLGISASSRTDAFAALTRAMTTAHVLRDGHLTFVVAPILATGGDPVRHLTERYAIAVFPYVAGRAGTFADLVDAGERTASIDVLASLHGATEPVRPSAPVRGFESIVELQAQVAAAFEASGRGWTGGPFAEPARQWLRDQAVGIQGLLDRISRRMAEAGDPPADRVITHGEPHPGNVIRTDAGLALIDWDTVGLARPERDLWFFAEDERALARYTDLTGRAVDPDVLALYRDAWDLADLVANLAVLRASHGRDEDTTHAFRALEELIGGGDRESEPGLR